MSKKKKPNTSRTKAVGKTQKTILLSDDLAETVVHIARKRGVSMSVLVEEGLRRIVSKDDIRRARRALRG